MCSSDLVAIADKECTVSFEAAIDFSVNVDYEDEDDFEVNDGGEPMGHPRKDGIVSSTEFSSALAKVKLDNSISNVEEIIFFELDIVESFVSVEDIW